MQNRHWQQRVRHYHSVQTKAGNGKVNVNKLLRRLKESEKKERNGNLVYAGVATAAIVISGIIIAL